jgi:acetyltransferase-like isoleucine patch superfamily enzyme
MFEDEVLAADAPCRPLLQMGYVDALYRAHRAGEGEHAAKLWTILTLERWLRSLERPLELEPPSTPDAETSVYQHAYVYGDVTVGEHTWIGPMTVLDGSGGLTIGSWCSVSAGVQIYTHSTVRWAVSGGSAEYEYAPTTIGVRTFIGPASVVAKGVTIGDGCVVGAHAFVNRDLHAGSLAFGLPARVVGRARVGADGAVQFEYDDPASAHPGPGDALR